MHKIERMMAIILALNKNRKLTANELARKFEVDVRTIYRDMQALGEINIPIISQPGSEGGYALLDNYFIPPVMFNKDEIFALMLSERLIKEVHIPGYSKYIKSAFLKLESVMNDEYMKNFHDIKKRIKFGKYSKAIDLSEFEFFDIIKSGLENNKKIQIKYFISEKTDIIKVVIQPYGIIYVNEVWYVVAFYELDRVVKSIPIHWIIDAELQGESFIMSEEFNINSYYCENHCIVKCREKDYEIVKIKVDKDAYYNIKDYIFFNDAKVELKESHYLLTIEAKNAESYISLGFRFYNEIEIMEPQWLRNKFSNELYKLAEKYKQP